MYNSAEDVVPIDVSSVDQVLALEAYALRATAAGTIKVLTRAGNVVSMAFTAGETRWVCTGMIYHSGTSATGIEALISTFAIAPNVLPNELAAVRTNITGDNTGTTETPPGVDGSGSPTDSP